MTVPASLPLFDQAHPWLMAQPGALVTARVQDPNGGPDLVGMSLRIPNALVAAIIAKETALAWAEQLRAEADQISGLVLPTTNGLITP